MAIDPINGLVALGLLLPALAVGKSGWWQLIMLTGIGLLVLIYWWVQATVDGGNEYEVVTT